ncbi:MAG TPA: DUF58 domain-containing protein [Planctomycetaceae bacterium]|jgi:uncharacterized protein (DUF58 family)|nr:DUF58 domain-containing protein [Planctomycetaceae bacterium]
MIPTRRLLLFGTTSLGIILVGQGAAWSVRAAWLILGGVILAAIVDGILASLRFKRIELRREPPNQLYVDQSLPVTWRIENRNIEGISLELRDQLPQSGAAVPDRMSASIPGRSRVSTTYQLRVTQRGQLAFGNAICRLDGPMGLCSRQFRVSAQHPVRSLPNLANSKAAELAANTALVRQGGSHRYRWRGAGTVFESLRDYSPEDDIRWLDWKATARRQQPITRNYEVERHQNLMLMVDASRMMTTYCGTRTKFDTVLEAAVLLTRAALDQGDAVGLVQFADRVDAYLPPRRDRAQNTRVMETLYAQYPRLVEPDFETVLTLVSRRVRRRSLVVLFTDVTVIEAARRMLAYVQMLNRRHLCLVVTIADESLQSQELLEPQTADDLYRVGVASQLMLERAELLERLRRSGAEIVDTPADQIAARTIVRYLDLKRRLRM